MPGPTRITCVVTPEEQAAFFKAFHPRFSEYRGSTLKAAILALTKAVEENPGAIIAAAFQGTLKIVAGEEKNATS